MGGDSHPFPPVTVLKLNIVLFHHPHGQLPYDYYHISVRGIREVFKNKPKFISAQLSVNVVALAVIDTDADVDADVATDSTIAAFATFDTVATLASFASFADGDPDVGSHLH